MDIAQTIASMKNHFLQANFSQSSKEARRNPWFLALLGLIAVFFIVNVIFVIFAVISNPGLVTDDYYAQGRAYEKNVITRLTARNNLHWETKLEIPEQIHINTPNVYRFSAVDSYGLPIIDAEVKFILYRPSDASADFVKPVEQIAPGLYQTELAFPLPGIWDLNLKVAYREAVYHHSHRLSVSMPTAPKTQQKR